MDLSNHFRRAWHRVLHWRRDELVAKCDRIAVLEHVADAGLLAPRYAFMVMMSCGIAVLGLLQNSVAVIIGAMLISPLMAPIVELGMGLATFDFRTVRGALRTVAIGVALALAMAAAIVAMSPLRDATPEILARTAPNLFDLLVAVFSGLAGAYATITRKGETLVGVAIATALMPPLAVVGYGLALANWHVALGAAFLFMTNLLAIALSVTVVGRLYGFGGQDTPNQTAWQAALIIGTFVLLSVPLGLGLRRIAWQSQAQVTVRSMLDAEAARVSGRITGLRIDDAIKRDGLVVDAVLMLPAHVPGLVDAWNTRLRDALGRPVTLRLREVLTTSDAAVAQEQATLAELRESVEQLQAAANVRATVRADGDARRGAAAMAVLAAIGRLEPVGEGWRLRLDPRLGLSLADARALEQRVAAAKAVDGALAVVPPLRLPLDWDVDSTASRDANTPSVDDATAVAAWALKRWNAGPVQVTVVARRTSTAQAALDAVTAQLRASGVDVVASTAHADAAEARRQGLADDEARVEVGVGGTPATR